jgi:hypothetical protein
MVLAVKIIIGGLLIASLQSASAQRVLTPLIQNNEAPRSLTFLSVPKNNVVLNKPNMPPNIRFGLNNGYTGKTPEIPGRGIQNLTPHYVPQRFQPMPHLITLAKPNNTFAINDGAYPTISSAVNLAIRLSAGIVCAHGLLFAVGNNEAYVVLNRFATKMVFGVGVVQVKKY